MGVKEHHLLLL